MATFNSPTRDTDTITNPPLSSVSLTWDEATFTWNEATGTWDNPFAFATPPTDVSIVTNPTRN